MEASRQNALKFEAIYIQILIRFLSPDIIFVHKLPLIICKHTSNPQLNSPFELGIMFAWNRFWQIIAKICYFPCVFCVYVWCVILGNFSYQNGFTAGQFQVYGL